MRHTKQVGKSVQIKGAVVGREAAAV